jgi:hypothetical protein
MIEVERDRLSSNLVFDLMALERPKVGRASFDFINSAVFDPANFVSRGDVVCRLNPEMARIVAANVATIA